MMEPDDQDRDTPSPLWIPNLLSPKEILPSLSHNDFAEIFHVDLKEEDDNRKNIQLDHRAAGSDLESEGEDEEDGEEGELETNAAALKDNFAAFAQQQMTMAYVPHVPMVTAPSMQLGAKQISRTQTGGQGVKQGRDCESRPRETGCKALRAAAVQSIERSVAEGIDEAPPSIEAPKKGEKRGRGAPRTSNSRRAIYMRDWREKQKLKTAKPATLKELVRFYGPQRATEELQKRRQDDGSSTSVCN